MTGDSPNGSALGAANKADDEKLVRFSLIKGLAIPRADRFANRIEELMRDWDRPEPCLRWGLWSACAVAAALAVVGLLALLWNHSGAPRAR